MGFEFSKNRIWMEDAQGRTIAEIDFPEESTGVVNITHTFVDNSLRGQGIAGRITQAAADQLRSEGRKAVLSCSYAVKWFDEHPEYADVLADAEAEKERAKMFGGPACSIKRN